MKPLVAALLLFATASAYASAASSTAIAVGPNQFLQSNPGYRERAGTFYEQSYLAGATKGLVAALSPEVVPEKEAESTLRAFIYDFLDQLILDEGEVSRRAHAGVVSKLDAVIESKTRDPALLLRYAEWKTGQQRDYPNPLALLTHLNFQSPPVALNTIGTRAGEDIVIQSLTSLEETAKYTAVVGIEPYQILYWSRPNPIATARVR